MASDNSATIVTLHQPRPKTPAERARAYRLRKKTGTALVVTTTPKPAVTPVTIVTPVTPSRVTQAVTASRRRSVGSMLLTFAAFALFGVGLTMNGWFAHGLGSTSAAGWLFMALGLAADLVALAVPSCAAALWQARRRGTAAAGWAIWAATFVFIVTSGIGFASTNVADVTLSRASRVTPAVTLAQTSLADAVTSRDRECKSGTGKFCREREAAVNERRQALDAATRAVQQTADPQVEAAAKIVSWVSAGKVQPTGDDFAMLRLILLALLPQFGGVLLMVARPAK
jgi:hypothetical protein